MLNLDRSELIGIILIEFGFRSPAGNEEVDTIQAADQEVAGDYLAL